MRTWTLMHSHDGFTVEIGRVPAWALVVSWVADNCPIDPCDWRWAPYWLHKVHNDLICLDLARRTRVARFLIPDGQARDIENRFHADVASWSEFIEEDT